jgi:hypothetical protein
MARSHSQLRAPVAYFPRTFCWSLWNYRTNQHLNMVLLTVPDIIPDYFFSLKWTALKQWNCLFINHSYIYILIAYL